MLNHNQYTLELLFYLLLQIEARKEFDVVNNLDDNTLTELEEDIKELTDIFKGLNIKISTYRRNDNGTHTSLIRKKCDKLQQQKPIGYMLPWL